MAGRGFSRVAAVAAAVLLVAGACGGGSDSDDADLLGATSPPRRATSSTTTSTTASTVAMEEAPGARPPIDYDLIGANVDIEPADELIVVDPDEVLAVELDGESVPAAITLAASVEGVVAGSLIATSVGPRTPDGLLVEALSVDSPASDGSTRLTVRPATLQQALERGAFDVSVPIEIDTETGDDQTAMVGSDGRTYRIGLVAAETKQGACGSSSAEARFDNITYELNGTFDIVSAWDEATGDFELDTTVTLGGSVKTTAVLTAALTCETTVDLIDELALVRIIIQVGPVPVVIVPVLDIDLKLHASAEAEVSASAGITGSTTTNAQYDSVEGFGGPTFAVSWGPAMDDQPTTEATGAVRGTLTPTIKALFYGLAGPRASVPTVLGLALDTCATPLWKLTLTSRLQLGLELPSWALPDGTNFEDSLLDHELINRTLGQGGQALLDKCIDLSGRWDIEAAGAGCTFTGELTLVQDGVDFTGEGFVQGDCGNHEGQLSGTLQGRNIQLGLATNEGNTVDFTGTVEPEGDKVAGSWSVRGVAASGTWSGTKS